MQQNVREMLDRIDEMLVQGDESSIQLWHVLTALRGPDHEDKELKTRTTAVLRAAAFPKTAEAANNENMNRGFADGFGAQFNTTQLHMDLLPGLSHFETHVVNAAFVLGIQNTKQEWGL